MTALPEFVSGKLLKSGGVTDACVGFSYSTEGLVDHGKVLTAGGPDQAESYARAIAFRLS